MVHACHDSLFRTQAEAHVDVSDLCHGGEGDHSPDLSLLDGADGTHDHTDHTEHKQYIDHLAVTYHREADDPVEDLDQQENIALGHQGGQDRRGRDRGITIGIRKPGVKGIQSTLNCQAHGDQPQRQKQRHVVLSRSSQFCHSLLDITHQQVAGKVIQKTDPQKQQAGTQQAHDHIADGSLDGSPILLDHNQTTGRDGIDLHEHVGSEKVVGVDQRQQGTEQKIYHNIVEVLLGVLDLPLPLRASAQHTQKHHRTEKQRHKAFQHAHPDLVAPGCGKMSHHIYIAFTG